MDIVELDNLILSVFFKKLDALKFKTSTSALTIELGVSNNILFTYKPDLSNKIAVLPFVTFRL